MNNCSQGNIIKHIIYALFNINCQTDHKQIKQTNLEQNSTLLRGAKLVTLKLGLGEEAQEGLLPPEPAEPAVSFPGVDLQPVMTDGEAVVSFLAAS